MCIVKSEARDWNIGRKFKSLSTGLQVPDFDGRVRGSAKPVVLRAEGQGIDRATSVEGIQMLAVVHVPEHGRAVLAARGAEGAVRGDGHGVEVAGVAVVVSLELAVGQTPHLEHTHTHTQTYSPHY